MDKNCIMIKKNLIALEITEAFAHNRPSSAFICSAISVWVLIARGDSLVFEEVAGCRAVRHGFGALCECLS